MSVPFSDKVVASVAQARGVDLSGCRPPVLGRRLAGRMATRWLDDPTAHLQRLEADSPECDRLTDAVGINVSSFFRNPLVFQVIRERILSAILVRKLWHSSREIRVRS